MNRDVILARLQEQPDVPVLIVGGGINGVGLLRELALQGVNALLIEKSDFCAGASAASSRMIHGGLRYLENGEFRLVRERNLLLQNAPHYVKPLPTTIPIFHRWAGVMAAMQKFLGFRVAPSYRGALLVKVGLSLSDLLTRQQRLTPAHGFQSRRVALARRRPQLLPAIVCTATYYGAWIPYPERLGLELVLRQTTLAFQCELTPALLDELAAVCAPLRQWSAAQTRQEINCMAQILLDNHGVDFTAERIPHHA